MAFCRTMLYEEFCIANMNIHIKGIGRVVKEIIGSNRVNNTNNFIIFRTISFSPTLANFEIIKNRRRLQVTEKVKMVVFNC